MIRDARVLQPEFVPRDVVHRNHEVQTLSAALDPVTNGREGDTTFLYGPSGVGKTCIANVVTDRLHDTVPDLDVQYVNCWENYTRFKTLYRLLEGLDQTYDIHRQSTPNDELVERLREHSDAYVVILDEVDQLRETSVLYELQRTPGVTLVLIANRVDDLFDPLDDRLASRLRTATRIHFDRYTVDELVAILADRVHWGLREAAVTDAQLAEIADAAAGDARVALEVIRLAARQSEREGAEEVSDAVIVDAVPEAKAEVRQRSVETLTDDQRVVYDIIAEHEPAAPAELYEEYRERVEDPRTERMVRNYLAKMAQYDLVEATGEGQRRRYHCR